MKTELTPSDRVRLLGRSELMDPGSCALCGSGNSELGYVHTDVWVDYFGHVYFCTECAGMIALAIGYLPAEIKIELQAKLNEQAALLSEQEAELNEARTRLDHYDSLFSDALANVTDRVVTGIAAVTEESESPSEATGVTPSEPESRESVIKESVTVGGPSDSNDDESAESRPTFKL